MTQTIVIVNKHLANQSKLWAVIEWWFEMKQSHYPTVVLHVVIHGKEKEKKKREQEHESWVSLAVLLMQGATIYNWNKEDACKEKIRKKEKKIDVKW